MTRPMLGGGSESSSSSQCMLDGSGNSDTSKHGSKINDDRNESPSRNNAVNGDGKQDIIGYSDASARMPVGVDIASAAAQLKSLETGTSNETSDERSPEWRPAAIGYPDLSARISVGVDAESAAAAPTAPFRSFETETSNGTSENRSPQWRSAVIGYPDLSARTLGGVAAETAAIATAAPANSFGTSTSDGCNYDNDVENGADRDGDGSRSRSGTLVGADVIAAATSTAVDTPFSSVDTGNTNGTNDSRSDGGSGGGGPSGSTYMDDDGHQTGKTLSRHIGNARGLNGSWKDGSQWRGGRFSVNNPYRRGATNVNTTTTYNNNGRANRVPRINLLYRPRDQRPFRGVNVSDSRSHTPYVIADRTGSGSAPGSQPARGENRQPQHQHLISTIEASTGGVDDTRSHTAGCLADGDCRSGTNNRSSATIKIVDNGGDRAGGRGDVPVAPRSMVRRVRALPSGMRPANAIKCPVEVAAASALKRDGNDSEAGKRSLQMQISTATRYRRCSTTPATTSPTVLTASSYATTPALMVAAETGDDGAEGTRVRLYRSVMSSSSALDVSASADVTVATTTALRRRGSTGSIGRNRSLPLARAGSCSTPRFKDGPAAAWRWYFGINNDASSAKIGPRRNQMTRTRSSGGVLMVPESSGAIMAPPVLAAETGLALSVARRDSTDDDTTAVAGLRPAWALLGTVGNGKTVGLERVKNSSNGMFLTAACADTAKVATKAAPKRRGSTGSIFGDWSQPSSKTGSSSTPKVTDGLSTTRRWYLGINSDASTAKIGPRPKWVRRARSSGGVVMDSDHSGPILSAPGVATAAAPVLSAASGEKGAGTPGLKEPAPAWPQSMVAVASGSYSSGVAGRRSAGRGQQHKQQQRQHQPYPGMQKKPLASNMEGCASQAADLVGRGGVCGDGDIEEVDWTTGGARGGQMVPFAGGKAAVVAWRGPQRKTVSL